MIKELEILINECNEKIDVIGGNKTQQLVKTKDLS
jgi:hypothetical protein